MERVTGPVNLDDVKPQKPDGRPGLRPEGAVKPQGPSPGVETSAADRGQTHPGAGDLLERALERSNLLAALKRVRDNAGRPGIDGMTVEALPAYLREHWRRHREDLLAGRYRPQPVRRVLIPKPGGGERELGIPTVLDRLIQQALLQVLQPLLDPTFSDASYGFRPGRSAHDAVRRAQGYVQEGYGWVVDIDIETFFDRVNHDILMGRLAKRILDRRILRLIRRYLEAGILAEGVMIERTEGTPQGGPLSPLLANVLLDEVDKALERRRHRFVRYADDLNVYVRTQRSGERVMGGLRQLLGKLKLRVNETKSKVARATSPTVKFLGFGFRRSKGATVVRVARASLDRMKDRVRQLTPRHGGRSLAQVCRTLGRYLTGWTNYFGLGRSPPTFAALDKWIRHRLRAIQLAHWKRGPVVYRAAKARGLPDHAARCAAAHSSRWWSASGQGLHLAIPNTVFDELGLPRLAG